MIALHHKVIIILSHLVVDSFVLELSSKEDHSTNVDQIILFTVVTTDHDHGILAQVVTVDI